MIRSGIVLSGLLLGSFFALPLNLHAQASVGSPVLNIMGEGCPVGLQAQRRGSNEIVQTKDHSPAAVAQQLQLNWTNRLQKEIVAAAIVVHGFDASARIIPVGSHLSPELKKVVAVKLDIASVGHATTHLNLQHFATISSVEVKSIEYADGTRWSAPTEGSCRIAPNLLLLVNATAQ